LPLRYALIALALSIAFSTSRPAAAEEDVPGVTDDRILVGMTNDLTGPLAFIGQQSSAGARLYLQHINEQGGVHGRRIELLVEDDGYQPARTVAAFRKLLDRDRVFCFVGNMGSSTTMATLPLVERERVPVVMPLNYNSRMSTPHKRYIFALDPNYPIQSWIMVKYIAEVEKKQGEAESPRLAVIYQDDDYGRDGLQGLRAAAAHYNMPIVSEESYKRGAVDFGSQVLNMKQTNPTHVILWTVYREGAAVMREARQTNWQPQFVGSAPAADDKIVELAGEAADGYLALGIIDFWSAEENFVQYRDLLAKKVPGQSPRAVHAGGFGVTQVLVEGLRRAGRNLTREKLVEALETLKEWDGSLLPPVTYGPGQHGGQNTAAFMMRADLERKAMVRVSEWVHYERSEQVSREASE